MKYDLLVISGGMLAVGIVIWGFSGHPNHAPRMHAAQEMKADPNLKLISEQPLHADRALGRHSRCTGELATSNRRWVFGRISRSGPRRAAENCGVNTANRGALIGIKPPTAI